MCRYLQLKPLKGKLSLHFTWIKFPCDSGFPRLNLEGGVWPLCCGLLALYCILPSKDNNDLNIMFRGQWVVGLIVAENHCSPLVDFQLQVRKKGSRHDLGFVLCLSRNKLRKEKKAQQLCGEMDSIWMSSDASGATDNVSVVARKAIND